MKRLGSLFLAMMTMLFLPKCVTPQQSAQNPLPSSGITNSKANPESSERDQAIAEVHSLANFALTFQDAEIRVRTTIMLADLVWRIGKDEAYGRELFQKSSEMIRSTQIRGEQPNPQSRDTHVWDEDAARRVAELLVRTASKNDRLLGRHFSEQLASTTGQDESNRAKSASELVNEGNLVKATEQIESTIRRSPSGLHDLLGLLNALFALNAKDPRAADQLFAMALSEMKARPEAEANDVLVIGNYLFTGRLAGPKNQPPAAAIMAVYFEGVSLQADVSIVRAQISRSAAYMYLEAATYMLARPSSDPEEQLRRGAAAGLLLPQASAFAPQFVPALSQTRLRARGTQSSELPDRNSADAKDLKAGSEDVVQTAERLKRAQRDRYIVTTLRSLDQKGDLETAKRLIDKIEDQRARASFVGLLQFRALAKLVDKGEPERVAAELPGLSSSLQRSLLRLGLAKSSFVQHHDAAGEALISEAIADIRKHDDRSIQPYVVLSAAEILAPFDPVRAKEKLREAVQIFNSVSESEGFKVSSWFTETLTLGDFSAPFTLQVPGVRFTTISAVVRLMPVGPSEKVAILELKDERLLSEGILALASSLMARSRSNSISPTQ